MVIRYCLISVSLSLCFPNQILWVILAKKYSTAQNWESTDSDAHLFVLEEDRAIASQKKL